MHSGARGPTAAAVVCTQRTHPTATTRRCSRLSPRFVTNLLSGGECSSLSLTVALPLCPLRSAPAPASSLCCVRCCPPSLGVSSGAAALALGRRGEEVCRTALDRIGPVHLRSPQELIDLRQLMHQQVNRHGKQANKFARLFAALYLACSGRDGHEKENLCFLRHPSAKVP